MQGFSYQRARDELQIPGDFQVEAMAAIGRPGRQEELPVELQQREAPNIRRNLDKTVCNGLFRF
jgi:hypothetical protein